MERKEAIKEIEEYLVGLDEEFATPFDKALQVALASLETDEAYQLEYERPRGKWNIVSWLYTCSNCSKTYHKDDAVTYVFCPNCGVKMKGAKVCEELKEN